MTAPLPVSEEDLHGFVDNELDDERRDAILAHLAQVPGDAIRIEAWRQQNLLLRAAFSQVALEQVPVSLTCTFSPRLISLPPCAPAGEAVRETYARRLQRRSLAFSAAAFMAGICITWIAGLSMSSPHWAASPAPATVTIASPMAARGTRLAVLAAADLHPAAPVLNVPQDFLKVPGAVEPALALLPMLKAEGLQLLRGEIRGLPNNPVRCLDFTDRDGTPLVLCITAAKLPATSDFQSLTAFAANAVYWRETASIYALAAPLEKSRLMALARRIHVTLTKRP